MENAKFHDIFGQTNLSFGEVPYYETQDASGLPIFPEECKITTEEFKLRFNEVEKDYGLNKLRAIRNTILAKCDWTQNADVKLSNIDEWNTYRQVLRDLPQTHTDIITDERGNIINIVYPTPPQKNKRVC